MTTTSPRVNELNQPQSSVCNQRVNMKNDDDDDERRAVIARLKAAAKGDALSFENMSVRARRRDEDDERGWRSRKKE